MAGYWLKLYTEILEDPKYYRLSDKAKLAMYELMLVAKKQNMDGELPCLDDIAFYTRRDKAWWEEVLTELNGIQYIITASSGYQIRKFAERQAPIPGPDRAKLSREISNRDKYKSNKYDPVVVDIPEESGVYLITFDGHKTAYVGASKNMYRRIKTHMTEMRNSYHPLFECFQDVGIEGVRASVLEIAANIEDLPKLEQKYIQKYKKEYELVNTVDYKPNRHWKNQCENNESAYESYGDIEAETDVEIEKEIDVDADSDSGLISTFTELYPGLKPRNYTDWNAGLGELEKNHVTPEIMRRAASELAQKGMKVISPGSLLRPCLMVMQREKKRMPDSSGQFKEYINH
jgi:predicted GIY-YIG superfamily endonuclease